MKPIKYRFSSLAAAERCASRIHGLHAAVVAGRRGWLVVISL